MEDKNKTIVSKSFLHGLKTKGRVLRDRPKLMNPFQQELNNVEKKTAFMEHDEVCGTDMNKEVKVTSSQEKKKNAIWCLKRRGNS